MSFIRCFCGNTNAHATVVHVNFKGPILCPIFSFQTPVMDEWTNHFSDLQPKCKRARLQLPVQNEGWAWKRGHTQSSRVAAPEGTVDTWLPANHHAVSETQVLPPVSLSEQLAVWQTAAVKGSQGVCAGARSLPTKSTSPSQKTTCRHGDAQLTPCCAVAATLCQAGDARLGCWRVWFPTSGMRRAR